jgi:acetyl esterase
MSDRWRVAGDSAGATLAFAAALALRGDNAARLAGIISYYPGVDLSHVASASYEEFGDGSYGLSRDDTDWFRGIYAPNPTDRFRLALLAGARSQRLRLAPHSDRRGSL